uniref:Pantothenate kinase 4 n=1 Tax=Lygus hesperus TaxID=30085 RepID=A0A0A9Z376_LYGHE
MRLDGPGDNKNVDLLVGDIYGYNARDLPAMLSSDTVASSFGKFGTQRLTGVSNAVPVDRFADDDNGHITSPVITLRGHTDGINAAFGNITTTVTTTTTTTATATTAISIVNNKKSNINSSEKHSGAGGTMDDGRYLNKNNGKVSGDMSHNCNSSNNAAVTCDRYHASSIDIVRSLLNMIAGNVTQLAYLHGKIHGVTNIFFTGGFVRKNAIMCSLISQYMRYWSSGEVYPHFL